MYYQNVSINDILNWTGCPFVITIFKKSSLPVITRLNDEGENNNILVIHDHRDISEKVVPYIKNKWKLITIKKTVQEHLVKRSSKRMQ